MNYYINHKSQPKPAALSHTDAQSVQRAMNFHRTIPGYEPTPLVSLPALARELGVAKLWVKDESKRFGLNAFKALGGSWAIARWMGEKLGLEGDELTFPALTEPKAREKLGEVTFVTATDGNHGRGVAWAARGTGLPGRWSISPRGAPRNGWTIFWPWGPGRDHRPQLRRRGAPGHPQERRKQLGVDPGYRLAGV